MDINQQVIDEFRANGGAVGGRFAGTPLLLLTTAGARTGTPRTTPLVYLRDGDRVLVFASNAGADRHPAWFHNVRANPQVVFEIADTDGMHAYSARAVALEGAERDRMYANGAELYPVFTDYQTGTERTVPVVALYPFRADDAERNRAVGVQLVQHHAELRAALAAARAELDGTEPANPGLGHELLGHCLTFCDNLQLHHLKEDGAFTAFEARFPTLRPAVARLRAEHRKVAEALTALRALMTRAAQADPAELAELRTELAALAEELDAHFRYEEEQLLPTLGV